MKRRAISISENSLIPSSSAGEEQEAAGLIQEEEEEKAGGGGTAKKRRLSADQVRTLEKHFEEENKLEPERKVRLADELGLHSRQVAVWFQNRRARWKTKQLESNYAALKASHDALRCDFDSLNRYNQSLLSQIQKLQAKLGMKEEVAADEFSCPDLVNLVDSRTEFLYQSPGATLKMKEEGKDEEEFIGASCFDFFADEKMAAMLSWY